MMNLIQNAYDAASMDENKTPQLHVSIKQKSSNVIISFADNGTGIAPEHLSRIFDPFFTTKSVGKGTGLGLSISYGIIEQHAGQLLATNLPQGGAQFTLVLPCESAS